MINKQRKQQLENSILQVCAQKDMFRTQIEELKKQEANLRSRLDEIAKIEEAEKQKKDKKKKEDKKPQEKEVKK